MLSIGIVVLAGLLWLGVLFGSALYAERHPRVLGQAELAAFLTRLAERERVAASTQNQALSALLFLYRNVLGMERLPWLEGVVRAKHPARIPVVLSRDELRRLLAHIDESCWLMAALLYGTGMRLMNACGCG